MSTAVQAVLNSFRLFLILITPVAAQTCPDLVDFYPGSEPDWVSLEQQLTPLLPQCFDNSEFFALYGGAQLNSGQLSPALESLERALLLNPENGAAQIDYAQALFEEGELFTALEINERLLQLEDLPAHLLPGITVRQEYWQSLTRQTSFQAAVLAGYDDNLNGAPDASQVTLTLSGEPIQLTLNPEFRPVSGPYLNMRLGAIHRQLAPDHQHNWSAEVRGRLSEDTASDLLQLSTRYAFIRPDRDHSWQVNGGINHLLFGGNALFTAADASVRYQPGSNLRCRPFYGLALQHQLYHQQSRLDGLESKASAGLNCPLNRGNGGNGVLGGQQLGIEFSLLNNQAIHSGRLGGDRSGWQLNMSWQATLLRGTLLAQLNHTKLDDKEGYSPLLVNGADRWLDRSYLLLQYRQPIQLFGQTSTLLVNLYHQQQDSNIELFETVDTTAEIGISWSF